MACSTSSWSITAAGKSIKIRTALLKRWRARPIAIRKYYTPTHNSLYRNNGDGTFTDVSQETGIAAHMGKGMSVSFADYDGDGFLDAFVANDTTPAISCFIISEAKIRGGWRDRRRGVRSEGFALSGMGSDFRDVNNDGLPDIWYTAVEHQIFPS